MLAIVGPTASGKSALGIEVALKINGEIINCDSVQVYKEIQIATAKVPPEERKAPEELNIRGTRLADIPTWRLKEAGMFGRGQVVKLNYG